MKLKIVYVYVIPAIANRGNTNLIFLLLESLLRYLFLELAELQ